MTIADPGWKGQPDPTEREDTPCDVCGGLGFLVEQGGWTADVPDDFLSVERCDSCQEYDDDEDAAEAAADYHKYAEWRWFPGDPGDWAIGPITTTGAT